MASPDNASVWRYREDLAGPTGEDVAGPSADVVGYTVHGTDGEVGKVAHANDETDSAYLIVHTGSWIFGRTVMIPAGVVERIDREHQIVHVDCSREQIKNAPEYHEHLHHDPDFRAALSGHYGGADQGEVMGGISEPDPPGRM